MLPSSALERGAAGIPGGGFSFQGTESVGLAAAETADPVRKRARAIRSVFWRILLFYIGSDFRHRALIGFTDPNLLHGDESHIAYSRSR